MGLLLNWIIIIGSLIGASIAGGFLTDAAVHSDADKAGTKKQKAHEYLKYASGLVWTAVIFLIIVAVFSIFNPLTLSMGWIGKILVFIIVGLFIATAVIGGIAAYYMHETQQTGKPFLDAVIGTAIVGVMAVFLLIFWFVSLAK